MRIHPVLMKYQLSTNRLCEFCKGSGIVNNDICYCVTTYYGQGYSRRTTEKIREDLKKFNAEERYASLRNS
jgi:hypothetical protein